MVSVCGVQNSGLFALVRVLFELWFVVGFAFGSRVACGSSLVIGTCSCSCTLGLGLVSRVETWYSSSPFDLNRWYVIARGGLILLAHLLVSREFEFQ